MMALHWLGMMLAALALVGCGYQLFAAISLKRFFGRARAPAGFAEAVTILKPLHGDEPMLCANLATCIAQDYGAAVQMLCGVSDPQDPAAGVVRQLRADNPELTIDLIVDAIKHGANAKIGSLINMLPFARHDLLVLSDSDMAVDRDYLATIVAALTQPGIGAVTCLYRGRADAGIWSVVAAGTISYVALPDIMVGIITGLARPCMGSTIALRRETLVAIGGFDRFADVLADDYAIGQAVGETGRRVTIPPLLLVHACADEGAGAVWRHHLRWAATIRSLQPAGYAGSIVSNPLPLAILASVLLGLPGLALVILSLVARFILVRRVDRIAGIASAPLWLLPAIDCLKFAVFVASFFVTKVDWRGARYTMAANGGITA